MCSEQLCFVLPSALEYPDVKEYFAFPIDASQDMLAVEELLLCENYQLLCAS